MTTQREAKFMERLGETSTQCGVVVRGCGCCGSPWIEEIPLGTVGRYEEREGSLVWIQTPA